MSGTENYRTFDSVTANLNYQFIFCSRYRRKVFLDTKFEHRFKQIVDVLCVDLEIQVFSITCKEDYVQISLNAPPFLSPTDIMAKIKRTTSKILRKEFSYLQHLPSLWTRPYLVSTECNLSNQVITRYLEEQKKRG